MIVKGASGKSLFAVAFCKKLKSRRTGRYFWKPGFIEYTHAVDADEAKAIIRSTTPVPINIVAAGPALGFFVNDNHGEVLSAS